jgi:enoyl-CoA hydratase
MPETGIGLFPDVGGSFFLPRLPGETGMYLGLTGTRLKTGDALLAGLATHFVPAAARETLLAQLADGKSPDTILQELAKPLAAEILPDLRTKIASIFSNASVEAILTALDADSSPWAGATAKAMRTKSPTAMKLAFRQIRNGKTLDFDECMRMEFRMVHRVIAGHDFYEGVRATIIDKDGAPKWEPASLSEVGERDIDAYFEPLGDQELPL